MKLLVILPLLLLACDPDAPVQRDCKYFAEGDRDKLAKSVLECVNNATAKNTGENQDADDWVEACKEQLTQIYERDGHYLWVNQGGGAGYHTGCVPFDSTGNK